MNPLHLYLQQSLVTDNHARVGLDLWRSKMKEKDIARLIDRRRLEAPRPIVKQKPAPPLPARPREKNRTFWILLAGIVLFYGSIVALAAWVVL